MAMASEEGFGVGRVFRLPELDEHVVTSVRAMFDTGLIDDPVEDRAWSTQLPGLKSERIAEQSMVLLKNEKDAASYRLPVREARMAIIGAHQDVGNDLRWGLSHGGGSGRKRNHPTRTA